MNLIFRLAASHPTLTAFFSIQYLAFFLVPFLIGYLLCPQKLRRFWILAVSMVFFWLVSGVLVFWLLFNAAVICLLGICLSRLYTRRDEAVKAAERPARKQIKKAYQRKARLLVALGAVGTIGVLLWLKYAGFFTENWNILTGMQLPVPRYVVPIGLSFFSLQAFSYLFDVYRETIPADRNPLRITLFLAFFPQIVEGPICRYNQTAAQLWDAKPITHENFIMGFQRLLYGMIKKMVIADRLNQFVEAVFSNYADYPGGLVALGAVAYTIQLYMDFSGSMDAVIGIARMLGMHMPENFNQPFFSRTISEFWNRWHISLGAWFRDYIFYPVTMSKPLKNLTSAARKKLGNHFGPLLAGGAALFCVWFCNGLWHGAAWSFIFFGMYHFVLILTGNLIAPAARNLQSRLHIDPECKRYRAMQILRTCILVAIGELFFRAETLTKGLQMFSRMVTDFRFGFLNVALLTELHLDIPDLIIVAVTLLLVLMVGLYRENGVDLPAKLRQQKTAVRWAVLYAMILYIVIFGAYGKGYIPVDPMYANF